MLPLSPDLLGHLANLAGDKVLGFVIEKTLSKVASVVSGIFDKRKAEASGDPERLENEVERLSDTIDSLEAKIRHDGPSWDWHVAREEASEPAFVQFAQEAMDAAAASPSVAKRLMLGQMIARRLQIRTESEEELTLRRALRVARDLTESQLLLLAAAVLVQWLPSENVPQFDSRDDAEAWLREYCGAALDRLVGRLPWPAEAFDTLASDGAILLDRQPIVEGNFGSHRDDVMQWLSAHGVAPYDGLEGEWGSNESHALFRTRFPTVTALQRLARNGRRDARGEPVVRRVDDTAPTPLGAELGGMVLEQLRTSPKAGEAEGVPSIAHDGPVLPTSDV